MKGSKPEVLIIILNYNGEGFIEDCLSSLEKNTTYPKDSFTVLTVDNGSSDGSDKIAEELSDEIIRNGRNLGFDIANNIGIYQNPDYDYYMLLNNDTEFEEEWLTRMIETAESKDAGIVGPKIVYPDDEIQSAGWFKGSKQIKRNILAGIGAQDFTGVIQTDYVHGSAFLINREVVEEIGYLDEMFTLGNQEEWDYCHRAQVSGYEVFVDGRAKIIHKEDKTKDKMEDDILKLLKLKNDLKEKTLNRSNTVLINTLYLYWKRKFGGSILGLNQIPTGLILRAFKEYLIDLPKLMYKRYNRTKFVPSYYSEGMKDYSKRYEALQ